MIADEVGHRLKKLLESGQFSFESARELYWFVLQLPPGTPAPGIVTESVRASSLYWQGGTHHLHVSFETGLSSGPWNIFAWYDYKQSSSGHPNEIDFEGPAQRIPWRAITAFLTGM